MLAAQTSPASGQGKIASVGRAIWSGFPLAWLELFLANHEIEAAISFMNRSWWPVTLLAAVLTLSAANAHTMSGTASIYSGGHTASGERASSRALTAAHPTLPFGSIARVTNRRTGRSVVVRINDRGPHMRGRVIDLTPAAANAIGLTSGVAPVSLKLITQ